MELIFQFARFANYHTAYDYPPSAYTSGQTNNGAVAGLLLFLFFIIFVAVVIAVVSMWKLFTKAGKPGWAAIVPIYNLMVMAEISGKPSWWGLLVLVPFANIVFSFWIMWLFVERFGKGPGFFIFYVLLPIVALPVLAFGKSQYQPPQFTAYSPFGPGGQPPYQAGPLPSPQPQYSRPEYPVGTTAAAQSPQYVQPATPPAPPEQPGQPLN